MLYVKEILSISSTIFAMCQHASWSWSLGYIWDPHLGGSRGHRGSAMVPFKTALVVSYRLSIVTIALSLTILPKFAINCLRHANQYMVGHFGAKSENEGVDHVSQILTRSRERQGAVVHKRNQVDNFWCLSTMHKCDRQTNSNVAQ